jgi:hypothetical protein
MDFIDNCGHLMRIVGWTKNVLIHDIIEVNSIYMTKHLYAREQNCDILQYTQRFLDNRERILTVCYNYVAEVANSFKKGLRQYDLIRYQIIKICLFIKRSYRLTTGFYL